MYDPHDLVRANRRERRKAERKEKKEALKSEAFKEGVRQTIQCSGEVTAEQLYKGIMNAIHSDHAELAIISTTEGQQYFTSLDLMPIFNMISDVAERSADQFNESMMEEIQKSKLSVC